jgi:hypothetical protein
MDKPNCPTEAPHNLEAARAVDSPGTPGTPEKRDLSRQPAQNTGNVGQELRHEPDDHREMLRSRCQAWNTDAAHQRAAGKARAATFTPASQSYAGTQAFAAASARWRAEHGLPPLSASAVKSYVVPQQIRDPLGQDLPAALQRVIFDAWIAGFPYGVAFWLAASPGTMSESIADAEDDDPLFPPGSLFASDPDQTTPASSEPGAAHDWQERERDPGWLVCTSCWSVAICPVDQPSLVDAPLIARFRFALVVCARHG